MTEQTTPYRYIDEDDFCLSARLLPNLDTGGVTDTLSITIEGSDEPQSVHVRAADVPAIAAGIVRAAGQSPAPADTAPAVGPASHGCTIGGQPAMPILVTEYNALVTRLAEAEARTTPAAFHDRDVHLSDRRCCRAVHANDPRAHLLAMRHADVTEEEMAAAVDAYAHHLAERIRSTRDDTRGAVQATKVIEYAANLIDPQAQP